MASGDGGHEQMARFGLPGGRFPLRHSRHWAVVRGAGAAAPCACSLSFRHAGAAAFSRSGDPTVVDFHHAVLLAEFGNRILVTQGVPLANIGTMGKLLRMTVCLLCAQALLLTGATAPPAVAAGGGGQGITDGFYTAGNYGAHFGRDESSAPGGFPDHNAVRRHGGQPGGAYPGYYGGHNCGPTFGQNPQTCQ
jgi:hypothetical protein